MLIHSKNIKKQFEKSMKNYNKNAIVQDWLAAKMLEELCKISTDFENILELGSGTGLLTQKISEQINFKNYLANDIVEKSKLYIQKIIPNAHFLHGNALRIKPSKKINLIISNAMFQWFNDFDNAIKILSLSMSDNCILAFSTFSPDNFKEIKELTGLTLNYKSKNELEKILKNNRFEILYSETFEKIIEFNNPLELLTHMKHTGVNSLSEKTWSIKNIKEFCDKYSKTFEKTKLTYSPIIIICKLKK